MCRYIYIYIYIYVYIYIYIYIYLVLLGLFASLLVCLPWVCCVCWATAGRPQPGHGDILRKESDRLR